ncbi:hypothetical protein J437_LFUL011340 [Ladona fulva]|uniref:Mitochondrial ribosomal protein S18C n=1 Tax=Ladona fulva TaxID=123851 RepID=A0A8K0K9B5_LADFU|nr:hypothetical protein J437_LFUL011340 [Ladona fulva]
MFTILLKPYNYKKKFNMSLQMLLHLRGRIKDVRIFAKHFPSVTRLEGLSSDNRINVDSKSEDKDMKDSFHDMPVDMQNPFEREKPRCILCKLDITPNYKNVRLLSQFISPFTGRTYGRHITGLCRAKQESVEQEIVKAQNCGLMPTYLKNPSYMKDPKIFDPENPVRPHRF